jgi:Domain of unknown function (DUF4253)
MVTGRLPGDGPVQLGPVALPTGRPVTGHSGIHIAWATADPVPGSGRIWAALSGLHPQTGLVPVQLDGLRADTAFPADRRGTPGDALRPWDNGEFSRPQDPGGADRLDAGAVLADRWRDWVPPPSDDDPELAGQPAPLTPAERHHALDVVLPRIRRAHQATPAARIGLVRADRPADVLAVIGWDGLANRGRSLLPLTAVLRSWEDRFGARLIDVGFADLRLLVQRPPRTLAAAQHVAAEQVVLADECVDGMRDIPNLAARLVNSPIWTFWWD